mgnify:CR=1 FL=1
MNYTKQRNYCKQYSKNPILGFVANPKQYKSKSDEFEKQILDARAMDFVMGAFDAAMQEMGYELVGTFHKCGYKFNKWYDMIWMEKMIGEHVTDQAEVKFGQWEI